MTPAAPSGVVTFLFTDIEGSTRRWEADAAAMRAALMAHDEVLRSSIEAHDGFLFSHTGDGVVAAFASPRSAVDAAVAAQRALGLPVRMGLATDSTFTSTSASGICSHVAIRSRATCQSDAHQRLFSDAITRRFGVRTQTLYPNQLAPVLASKFASGRRPPR